MSMSQKKKMKKIKLFFKQIIRIIVRFAIKLYFVVIYRVKVIGQENIPKNKKEPENGKDCQVKCIYLQSL